MLHAPLSKNIYSDNLYTNRTCTRCATFNLWLHCQVILIKALSPLKIWQIKCRANITYNVMLHITDALKNFKEKTQRPSWSKNVITYDNYYEGRVSVWITQFKMGKTTWWSLWFSVWLWYSFIHKSVKQFCKKQPAGSWVLVLSTKGTWPHEGGSAKHTSHSTSDVKFSRDFGFRPSLKFTILFRRLIGSGAQLLA